jgi:hypothetical protein
MKRPNKAALWVAGVTVMVAGVVTFGLAMASSIPAVVGPPIPARLHLVCSGTCATNTPGPLWSPPVGAVDRQGHVVKAGEQIVGPLTCCGWTAYTFNGRPLTDQTVDWLRLPDGRVRLFVPDIAQVQSGRSSTPAAAAKVGAAPVLGELEVAPAPPSAYPVRAGDNSLGW